MGDLRNVKTSKDVPVNDAWEQEILRFEYNGKNYAVPVEGHLVLRDLSIFEIKDKLNKLPGKYAYWKSLRVDVELKLEAVKADFNIWMAEKYLAVAQDFVDVKPKPTETKLNNEVILRNRVEYRDWLVKIRKLTAVQKHIDVLVKSYEMQSWTLRSVGALVQAELNNIEVHGTGNLADIGGKNGK